ncbi:MAG: hypothetical protein HOP11_03290 [Saprospiraceae bacterium]|nr:hypothetical protein [Saprospiraceae bacterium]
MILPVFRIQNVIYFFLFLGFFSSHWSCELLDESNPPADDPHKFLEVVLGGEFARKYEEIADVFVDGVLIGEATASKSVVMKDVAPGNYTIRVETKKIPSTITANVTKKESNGIKFVALCEAAKITFKASLEYLLEPTQLLVFVQGLGVSKLDPGVSMSFTDISPEVNRVFTFYDKNGKLRHTVTKTLKYSHNWSYDIPYN